MQYTTNNQQHQMLYPTIDDQTHNNNFGAPTVVSQQQPQQHLYANIDERIPLVAQGTQIQGGQIDANGNPVIDMKAIAAGSSSISSISSSTTPEAKKRTIKNVLMTVCSCFTAQLCMSICLLIFFGVFVNFSNFFIVSIAKSAQYQPAANCTIVSRNIKEHSCGRKSSATCYDIVFDISFYAAPENHSLHYVPERITKYLNTLDVPVLTQSNIELVEKNLYVGQLLYQRNLDAKKLEKAIAYIKEHVTNLAIGSNQKTCWYSAADNNNKSYSVMLQEPMVMVPFLFIAVIGLCCTCLPCCCWCGCCIFGTKKIKDVITEQVKLHKEQQANKSLNNGLSQGESDGNSLLPQ